MPRLLTPLAVVLGVLLCAIFIFSDSKTEQADVIGEEVPAKKTPSITPESAPDLESAAEANQAALSSDETAEESITREVLIKPEGTLVLVVDGNSERALPGAKISYLDLDATPVSREQIQMLSAMGLEVLFEMMGTPFVADQNGHVYIPPPSGGLLLAGSTRTHFGVEEWDSMDDAPLTLSLDLHETVSVHLTDESGQDVEGMLVGLFHPDGFELNGLLVGVSDKQGLVMIKVTPAFKSSFGQGELYVTPLILAPHEVEASVDLRNLPVNPIELVVPQTGSMQVHVVNDEGVLEDERFHVILRSMTYEEGSHEWIVGLEGLPGQTENGVAFFPHIALGQRVYVEVGSLTSSRRADLELDGPVVTGEKMQVNVTLPASKDVFLTGRVLNTEGMVAKNLELDFELRLQRPNHDSTERQSVRTDLEGRFRYRVDPEEVGHATRTATVFMRRTKRKAMRRAIVDCSGVLHPGENDIGDLVVDVFPVMAAGVVLKPDGDPLAGASIHVERERFSEDGKVDHPRKSRPRSVMISSAGVGKEPWWEALEDHEVFSKADGSFELRGAETEGRLRLAANGRGFTSVKDIVAVGESHAVLQVGQAIQVSGKILYDPEIPMDDMLIYITDSSGMNIRGSLRAPNFSKGVASYIFMPMAPGEADMSIKTMPDMSEVHSRGEISIYSESNKLELPDWDLRGQIHTIQVTPVGEGDGKLEDAWVWKVGGQYINYVRRGSIQLYGDTSEFDFEVGAEGMRTQSLSSVSQDIDVVLRPGFEVQLTLENLYVIPEGWKASYTLSCVEESVNPENRVIGRLEFDENGFAQLTLPVPGTYSWRLSLMREGNRLQNTSATTPDTDAATHFEVLEQDGVQSFRLNIPEDALKLVQQEILDWEEKFK